MCPRCPSDYQEEHFLKQHAPCSAFPSLISEGDGGLFATSATCHSCCSSLTLQVPSILFERKRYCYQYPFCANSNNREHVPYPATTPPMTSRKGQRNCGTASSISTIVSKRKSISTRISTRRATITKLEICESIIQGVECRFGSKCAFAHSESELQFTTLRERAEAGLIDILTYRTRPCLDHVMTGSCPFGSRCVGIHDARVKSIGTNAWLPYCRRLNALPTDVHIDWNSGVNQALLHHGSIFREETATVFSSYDNFSEKVCQHVAPRSRTSCKQSGRESRVMQQQQHVLRGDDLASTRNSSPREMTKITDLQRLQIALAMIPKACPLVFKYDPSHLIFGTKVCMIRQSRAFDLCLSTRNSRSSSNDIVEIPNEDVDPNNPSHIIVREIAFGQNSDPDSPPITLWLGVPEDDITTCNFKEQLKHNAKQKSRRRRKNSMNNKNLGPLAGTPVVAAAPLTEPSEFGSINDLLHWYHKCHRPFKLFYSQNPELHDLMRNVMMLEIKKMKLNNGGATASESISASSSPVGRIMLGEDERQGHDIVEDTTTSLQVEELVLTETINALGRHFLDSSWWPVNQGREYVSDSTPVPPAEGIYCAPPKNAFQKSLWSSLVENLCSKNDAELNHHYGDEEKRRTATMGKKKRLPVFEDVSVVVSSVGTIGSLEATGVSSPAGATISDNTNAPFAFEVGDRPQHQMCSLSMPPSSLLPPPPSFSFCEFESQWKIVQDFYRNKNDKKQKK